MPLSKGTVYSLRLEPDCTASSSLAVRVTVVNLKGRFGRRRTRLALGDMQWPWGHAVALGRAGDWWAGPGSAGAARPGLALSPAPAPSPPARAVWLTLPFCLRLGLQGT